VVSASWGGSWAETSWTAGEYDLRQKTSVPEAVAIAGGFASTAKTQVFLIADPAKTAKVIPY
jgi:F0F1-type ATP synthase epsilon subunit